MSLTINTMTRVYPRVCGGTPVLKQADMIAEGLSPRVRGNLGLLGFAAVPEGSIPACAGEPGNPARRPRLPGVYPRVCGGTSDGPHPQPGEVGLSPRVRGNLVKVPLQQLQPGSIPACAGEPAASPPRRQRARVYPRVCGGTASMVKDISNTRGLSPRVRGNLLTDDAVGVRRGSIPACAGEPNGSAVNRSLARVYPRVCGGTHYVLCIICWVIGLSPRVRGNLAAFVAPSQSGGSIPACAGEPDWLQSRRRPPRVYPRVCGGTSWPRAHRR